MIYRIITGIIDRLTGFNLVDATEKALKFDFLSRAEIESYHKEQFSKLAGIASTSEFYSGFAGFRLQDFPLVRREEYMQNQVLMQTTYDGHFHESISSGSTGIPIKHYVTKEMLLAKRASHQKMLRWYGLKRDSSEFKLGGIDCALKQKIYYIFRNKRFYSSYYISVKTLSRLVKKYNSFKPAILYGYPTTINKFLMFAKKNDYILNPPKAIICHAENLYDKFIENFKSVFPDVKVINQYWSTEANIAVTCPAGNLHVDEDTVICEILNQDKNGVGDLYITNLFSYKVPIIRYCIGDKVKISEKPCPCGRNTKIIESIEGRAYEYLEMVNGDKFPITAIDEDTFYENIMFYQLVHFRKERRLLFKYIPVNKDIPVNKKAIEHYIGCKFGLTVDFEQISDIEYSSGGKAKRMAVVD